MTAELTAELTVDDAWLRLLRVRTEDRAAQAGLVREATAEGDGTWRWEQPATREAQTLAALYTPLCLAGRDAAFAQLGQSIDGFIATRTGHSNYVTGEEDRLHLHRLRALADAVVVGAGTTVADDPQLTVRACEGPNPVRVVLDPSGRAARELPKASLFTDGKAPTLRLTGGGPDADAPAAAGVETVRLPCGERGFDPRLVLETLAGAPARQPSEVAG